MRCPYPPYLGTEFYRKFESEGRIICTDYEKYTGGMVIVRHET